VLATGHLFLGKQSSYTSGKPSAGITGKPGGPAGTWERDWKLLTG